MRIVIKLSRLRVVSSATPTTISRLVLVDVPKDITAQKADFANKPLKPYTVNVTMHQDGCIAKAAELIKNAERPFLYAGGGIYGEDGAKTLKAFAELIDAPVSSSLMGQGSFDETDSRYMGMLGMHGTKTAAEAIKNCDLFIGIGTRFSDRVIGNPQTFAPDAKVLHIDIDPAEINKNIKVYHQVIGDSTDVMKKLIKLIPQQSHSGWMGKIKIWEKQYECRQKGTDELTLTPQHLIETLDKLTGGEALIATEVGQSQMWAAQYLEHTDPRSFLTSGGLGTMGYGYGAAIGAKVAFPDRRVIHITGDGSFHMNMNEACTAVSYNLPIITVIFDNEVLGMVRQWQTAFYGKRYSQTDPHRKTDYVKVIEGFGGKGYRAHTLAEFNDVFQKALKEDKCPVWIDCAIPKDEKVLPLIPAGKTMDDIIIEDCDK